MAKSSYYTPRCMAFKAAFKGMPGVTTFEHELVTYDGQCTDFGGSAYVDKLDWLPSSQPMANSWCTSTIPDARLMPMVAKSSPRNTHNNNGCSDITNRLTGL